MARVTAQVKRRAGADLFAPASHVVDEVLINNINDATVPSLPKPSSLARTANRTRKKQRPKDPTDLDFIIEHHTIPEGKYEGTLYNFCRQCCGTRRQLLVSSCLTFLL